MSTDALKLERFAPDDPRMAEFEAVRTVAQPGLPTEPITGTPECLIARRGDDAIARCTVQVVEGLHGAPGRTGVIGHYETVDRAAGTWLLVRGREWLVEHHARRVLGPMNGNTWARYRLALPPKPGETEGPPFLGEPLNPPDYPAHFASAGFEIGARYESRIDLEPGSAPVDEALARAIGERGIRVRPLDPDRFDQELEELFAMSLAAFADNLYYTPIEFAAFRTQYERIRPILDPGFVLLAHDPQGTLIAYQFAFPDPLSQEDGRATRAIVKTVATLPAARGMGLANHMLDLLRARAFATGYRSVIHALMHIANASMKMSARHRTEVFRRYALYTWSP